MLNDIQEKAYKDFFGSSIEKEESKIEIVTPETKTSSRSRLTAKGNVDDLDKLGEILRKLTNAAWGSNWGILSPDTSRGDNPEEIIVPQINYGINLREISQGSSPKPTLMDTIDEVVNGIKTGDSFRVYRQSFDCIVEFNFWASTSKDCRTLMNDFEKLIGTYSGYLKESGVSEIFFLKEVPSQYSLNNADSTPMKCIYYFIRLERNEVVRVSQIKEIELKLKNNNTKLSPEQSSDDIYNKITYKL